MGEFKNEIFVMIMLLYDIYSFINRGDPFEKFVEKKTNPSSEDTLERFLKILRAPIFCDNSCFCN